MKTARPKLNVKNLKDLGLYSPYDVSKWCIRSRIESAYIEKKNRVQTSKYSEDERPGMWVVLDARHPAEVIKRFLVTKERSAYETSNTAMAWAETFYDVSFKRLPSMRSMFAEPAVDLLLNELDLLYRVWSPEAETSELSEMLIARIKEEYAPPSFVSNTGQKVLNY